MSTADAEVIESTTSAPKIGPPAEGPPVIRVRGLNHFFGEGEARKQALYENNLEVGAGEIVIMTGPSGSGKTTLLTLVGGLRTVQQGSLQVLGQEMNGLGPKELVDVRKGIGFIFQAHNLFESLTAYRNVKMALELQDQAVQAKSTENIRELLTILGLKERIFYKPANLSGGQRQRVAIARALINNPKLVLADEPTAALDQTSGRTVVELLKQRAKTDKCTCIIVTHDPRILDVADRLINMVDGKIVSNSLVKEMLPLTEFLRNCEAFRALGLTAASALVIVADKMAKERFLAGQVIIRQGDVGDKFYLIWQGSVDIINEDTGEVIATSGKGKFFGEMALLYDQPRSRTVRARENVVVYTLGKADFENARKSSPSFEKEVLTILYQRK